MTTVKEQFMQILPQIQRDVPSMPDSEVQKKLLMLGRLLCQRCSLRLSMY